VEDAFSVRRFVLALVAFAFVLLMGTITFHFALEESWIDALYRSVVTVTLTGLASPPGGDWAEIFTMILLFSGVAIFLYVAGAIVEVISRGVASGAWAERKRRRVIEKLEGHYIICGYGRVGRQVGREFRDGGVPFVVLDFNPDAIEAAREAGVPYIEGNGTDDEDLAAAGLDRAQGLVASSDSDADNLYITLSARSAHPDLLIVSRASDADAAKKLRVAGADRVVQPYSSAGTEMAKLVLKPQVAAFLDAVSATGGTDLRFEEIEVRQASGQTGRTIKDLHVRRETGALIIALRKRDGSFDTTPSPEVVLEEGDVMICVGTPSELSLLEELFAPQQAVAR
jgi:voltage-gated potassium channel